MKFESILKKARTMAAKADISGIDFLAVQINITGDDPGVFYVEVKDGCVNVEPYEYYDRQCAVTISSSDLNKLIQGKIDPGEAYDDGRLQAEGDLGKALEFSELIQNKLRK